jgi:GMP synthase (glutamine-hydrolysing)
LAVTESRGTHPAMTPESVCVFQHIDCEDLGTFAKVLAARGLRADYVRLFAGDCVPHDWAAAQALVFLGGPMSVNDEQAYAYLAEEKAVIRAALEQHKPILGVCLGAQLLAAAACSRVFPGTRPEIGWEPITLTADGRQDSVLSGVADLAAVFHWHGETFDLPAGATHLASSAITQNQAFRLGSRAYGLQFHLEVDAAMIEAWIRAYPQDLGPHAEAATQRIVRDTVLHADALREAAGRTMSRFLDLVT